MADEVGGQDIDVVLIGAHVRVVGGDSLEALVPERHGEDNAVGFCSRRQMLFAFAGLLEGVTDYSGYASAGEHAFLGGAFFGGAVEEADGAEIYVLLEGAADGDQQAPEGDVVGDGGVSYRAQVDGVERTQLL